MLPQLAGRGKQRCRHTSGSVLRPRPAPARPNLLPSLLAWSPVQVFDKHMPGPNQIASKLRQDVNVTQDDLLKVGPA